MQLVHTVYCQEPEATLPAMLRHMSRQAIVCTCHLCKGRSSGKLLHVQAPTDWRTFVWLLSLCESSPLYPCMPQTGSEDCILRPH